MFQEVNSSHAVTGNNQAIPMTTKLDNITIPPHISLPECIENCGHGHKDKNYSFNEWNQSKCLELERPWQK